MEDILERARKFAEQAEVYEVSHEETPVSFESNRLKQVQSRQSHWVALRLVLNGRVGSSTANDASDVKGLVDKAVEVAQFGPQARFELPGLQAYQNVRVFDGETNKVTLDEMVELGQSLIDATTAHTKDLLCSARVSRSTTSLSITNSRGGQAKYRKTTFGLGVYGTLINGTDMLFVGDGENSCHPVKTGKRVTSEVIRQLEWAKRQATAKTGTIPVVFTPSGVASAFIPALETAFNGRVVLQGASPLAGKLGQKMFDERFSLWDDATLPYRPGSRICDDEGVPTRRTALIDGGTVASFYYDLQTAGMAGTKSTGNGSRSGGSLPGPSSNALVIAAGDTRFNDMIKDMKEGLVVEDLMGAEQGNILGGDFSGNVLLGYKVENGEVVGRVKDTTVGGNVYQILKNVKAISKERKWLGGSLYAPAIYCAGLAVSSK